MKLNLYFVAIVLDGDTGNEITAFKKEMSNNFGVKHALKSPPHITLISPLKASDQQIDIAEKILEKIATEHSSFDIGLDGFGVFESRVVFVRVLENDLLAQLKLRLESKLLEAAILQKKEKREFHPHVTIAHRDLTKRKFELSWPFWENRSYQQTFRAGCISLLEHKMRHWSVSDQFSLQLGPFPPKLLGGL